MSSSGIEYKTVLPYARLAVKKTAAFSLPIFIQVNYISQFVHQFQLSCMIYRRLYCTYMWRYTLNKKGSCNVSCILNMYFSVFNIWFFFVKTTSNKQIQLQDLLRNFRMILEICVRKKTNMSQLYIMSALKHSCCLHYVS